MPITKNISILMILLMNLIGGCDKDEEAKRIAREAANRQAQQNTVMADVNKEVATGTRHLVEADAAARKEIIGVHRELQAERTRLDKGHNALEEERQQMARERRTESMLVPVITLVGSIGLVALLLGFCWRALSATPNSTEAQLNELLVYEILPDGQSLLIPSGADVRSLERPAD